MGERGEEEKVLPPGRPGTPAPGSREASGQQIDPRFGKDHPRDGFRRFRAGLLLPQAGNQTLTALATPEPRVGAPPVQTLPWFRAESTGNPDARTQRHQAGLATRAPKMRT